jgi:uncharacterized protein YdaU (DUF1376 family)
MYYYKFNIADWHLATSHLSLEEEAIYFRLINYYYDTEQAIPEETQSVIRRLRLGSYSEIVGIILKEFFTLESDGWHHKRCDDEISQYHDKAEVNQINGKKGGRPKKTQTVSKDNPDITLTKNHKPITNNHSIDVAKAPKAKRLSLEELPKEWEDFCKTERKDLNPIDVFNQFRDYWIAQGGQKGAKLDWFATWRNWVRNQRSQNPVSKQGDDKSWMFSNQGIEAKAKELGVNDYGIQNHQQLKDKVLLVMAKKAMQ